MVVYSNQTLDKYHIDFETSNVSFLKMAATLRKMGVKNWYFFLKIYNKKLCNLNPYSKDLTFDERVAISKECAENRWYFYREVFRVGETGASTDEGGGSEFKLNRGNLAYLWATALNISVYMILPRQTGKTWAAIANCVWIHQFKKNSSILHFNKNQQDANDNLTRIKTAINMLPSYMRHSDIDQISADAKRKIKNNEKFIKNVLDSTIVAMSSAGNEAKADAMARGKTAENTWYDELAFIFFNRSIYTAATPAFEKARENAIKNQSPYGISITTTPGDLATPHGAFAYKMMEKCIPFMEEMFDWSIKKLYKTVYDTKDDKDEHVPYIFIQYNYRQLGLTDEWYRKRYKNMADPLRARREYLLEWIDTNENSPFDPDDVEMIGEYARAMEMRCKKVKISKYYMLHVYDEYKGKKPVLISCDVSGSIGRDNSTLVVVNPETLKPMAFFQSNTISSRHFKKIILKVCTKFYPHCILTIENNSVGGPLLSELEDTPIRAKIYRERKTRKIDLGPTKFNKKSTRTGIEYGHNVNGETRPQMMDILESLVRYSQEHLGYPELYNEIRFMQLKNGRIDHGNASHDDVTMAYLGALWIVRHGKGLRGKGIYFNISDGSSGEDNFDIDEGDAFKGVDKYAIKKPKKNKFEIDVEDEADDLIDFLRSEQPVMTSSDLMERDRKAYLKERDRIDGVLGEFDDDNDVLAGIDNSTQRLLLRHSIRELESDDYLIGMNPEDDDPFGLRSLMTDEDMVPSGVGLFDHYFYD